AGQGEANGGEGAPGSTPAARAAGSSGGTGADQGAAGAAAPSGAGSREALPEVPVIPLSYSRVATSVGPGDRILLDDGNLVLTVEGGDGVYVYCRVDAGGRLLQGKKATLPAESLDLPYLNE